MTKGGIAQGYTVLETMVFLVVSAVLFVAFTSTIRGKQETVEFTQATKDAQAQVEAVINEVATGYFPPTNGQTCTVSGSGAPSFVAAPSTQGTNSQCVFMGKVIHFGVAANREFHTISIAGRRVNTSNNDATTLKESLPVAIPGATNSQALRYTLYVTRIVAPNVAGVSSGSVAFLTTLPKYQTQTNTLASGTQRVSFGIVPGTSLSNAVSVAEGAASSLTDQNDASPNGRSPIVLNPKSGIYVCLANSATVANATKKAMLVIGEGASQASVRLETGDYRQDICEG